MAQKPNFDYLGWGVNAYNITQVIEIREGPDNKGNHYIDGRHQVTIANCEGPNAIANASLIATAQRMRAELEKQLNWLLHIRPQVDCPPSVKMGFDQAIKYIGALLAEAGGEKP